MNVHVFLGPSLNADDAHGLATEAGYEFIWHPPAHCGSLVPLIGRADAVLLVDGVYERIPAVWHKEIIAALAAGTRVFGASSMGALRAAECAPWGAEPLGTIAHRFASGEWTRDDLVAVAHGPAETDYRALTVPLVDVDDHVSHAVHAEVLDRAAGARLSEAARTIFYAERSWERLIGLDPQARVLAEFATQRPGLKARDAAEAITTLPYHLSQPRPRPRFDPSQVRPTAQFTNLEAHSALGSASTGALEAREDWPDLLRGGLVRALLSKSAALGIARPTSEAALTQVAHDLGTDRAGFYAWGESVGLDEPGVTRVAVEQVMLARLWEMYGTDAKSHVIDHLRVTGRYGEAGSTRVDGGGL